MAHWAEPVGGFCGKAEPVRRPCPVATVLETGAPLKNRTSRLRIRRMVHACRTVSLRLAQDAEDSPVVRTWTAGASPVSERWRHQAKRIEQQKLSRNSASASRFGRGAREKCGLIAYGPGWLVPGCPAGIATAERGSLRAYRPRPAGLQTLCSLVRRLTAVLCLVRMR
jgi:hypothetical protein